MIINELKTIVNSVKNDIMKYINSKLVNSDWDQNDKTKLDYIKNRTHGITLIEPKVILETTITNIQGNGQSYISRFNLNINIEKNKKYTVLVDGVKHESVWENNTLVSLTIVNNIPLFKIFESGSVEFSNRYNTTTANRYSVDFTIIEDSYEIVQQLDKKYIPPSIDLNEIILKDEVTGYRYFVRMNNGNLVYANLCTRIYLHTPPTFNKQLQGASFNSTGMVVMAKCEDGSERDITSLCNYDVDMTVTGVTPVTITYVENNTEFKVSTEIELFALIDFDYSYNGDGTATITGWKGTLNGVPSTEMVFPNDNPLVKL